MARVIWSGVLFGLPLATLWGGYRVLALEDHSVLMLSLAVGGLLGSLFLCPLAIGALFPKLAKKANTPLDQLGAPDAAPAAAVPIRQPSAPRPAPAVEKIIERQVVVVRCRYCNELTPADLSDCKNCGARSL